VSILNGSRIHIVDFMSEHGAAVQDHLDLSAQSLRTEYLNHKVKSYSFSDDLQFLVLVDSVRDESQKNKKIEIASLKIYETSPLQY